MNMTVDMNADMKVPILLDPSTRLCQLKDWAVITVTGPDATDFLQSQLTNSVKNIGVTEAGSMAKLHEQHRFAGYCSAKGRLMASFWISRHNVLNDAGETVPQYQLLLSADLAASLAKRLSMFVLRSKVKVMDCSGTHATYGLVIEGTDESASLNHISHMSGLTVAELPGVSVQGIHNRRYLVTTTVDQAQSIQGMLSTEQEVSSQRLWSWLEVQSAIPRVTQASFEQFVPQMINMESLRGIDFQKGCYPGQEVVARSQYRGTIKRRLQLAHLQHTGVIASGTEIFHSDDPSQPCGMVVLSAQHPLVSERVDLQVECKLEALNAGTVHLGSATGPQLHFSALPYPLIDI